MMTQVTPRSLGVYCCPDSFLMVRWTVIPTHANSAAHTTHRTISTMIVVVTLVVAIPLMYGLELMLDQARSPSTAAPVLIRNPMPQMP